MHRACIYIHLVACLYNHFVRKISFETQLADPLRIELFYTHICLHVCCRSRQQTELGKIVNLMSADVNHVMQFFYPFFNQLFSAPALLIASLILLYFQIRSALSVLSNK